VVPDAFRFGASEVGGDTLCADLGAAYQALSEPLKRAVQGLTARNDFVRSFRIGPYYSEGNDPEKWERRATILGDRPV
jgi:alpha-ketoglutarate-dependent taurine dioxygenase